MTRRDAERAVIEAARRCSTGRNSNRVSAGGYFNCCNALDKAVDALDAAPQQPDLDALNAAVAEAVEAFQREFYRQPEPEVSEEWTAVVRAANARREAMKPKPTLPASMLDALLRDLDAHASETCAQRAAKLREERNV
jgi:hypothetical protein